MKKAYLVLENGTIFEGKGFGAEGETLGEAVFTTGMTGYQETLTDPSYCGQIIIQTFPMIGNYGVNNEDFEAPESVASGYVVREFCDKPSNFRSTSDIDSFLKEHNIVGIYDIDTRALTRKIRDNGVMNAAITTDISDIDSLLQRIKNYSIGNPVDIVSVKEKQFFNVENPKFNVVLFDFGHKHNIRRWLNKLGCNVTICPNTTTAEEIRQLSPDGIMLSNGPGDPADDKISVQTLKDLIPDQIPTFGICLGHQLLALANGARTEKLKYGHRGANQPVKDLTSGRTYITSQNHGYTVVNNSLPKEIGKVSYVNGNDGTCEGIVYTNAPAFTVQFHPEAKGGPLDTGFLFENFIKLMEDNKKG